MFALVIGAVIALVGLLRGADPGELALLVGVFVGGAFGGKGLQRFAEGRGSGDPGGR